MNAQQLVKELEQRKQKNLAFFKEYFPQIYQNFHGANFKNSRLNIDPNTLEINLLENEKAIYPENAKQYNIDEANQFSDIYKEGSTLIPLRHHFGEDFYEGRFAHGLLARFLYSINSTKEGIGTSPYKFEHSLGQVVFLGSGMGIHIKQLIKSRDIQHVLVIEHNHDRFLSSLYVTDWVEIITPFLDDNNRSFCLSAADNSSLSERDRVLTAYQVAWNQICDNVPFMPVQTVYYVHQGNEFYTKVANRLNDQIETYLESWGHYDDEVNQLNHVLHNIRNGIPIMQKQDFSNEQKITLVCGNGPSLDNVMPLMKKYRDKLNIISSGSTTHSLLKQDIYPDFCVSLESDVIAYHALTLIPPEKCKQINLIASCQTHPGTFSLFKESLTFIKKETAYGNALSNGEDIENGNPSAANASLAIAIELNLPNIYLCGMDFGFIQHQSTHSKNSFYDKDNEHLFAGYQESIIEGAYKLEENHHGSIYSTSFYSSCRNHVERKLVGTKRSDIYNLSRGATINYTQWATCDELQNQLKEINVISSTNLFEKIATQKRIINKQEVKALAGKIGLSIKKITQSIIAIVKDMKADPKSIDQNLFRINRLISENSSKASHKEGAIFLRGVIWFWLMDLYAIRKRHDQAVPLATLLIQWKKYFLYFLENVPVHFKSITIEKSWEDPLLNLTISQPEPEIEKWLDSPKLLQ